MTDLTIDGEGFRVEVEGDAGRPALMLSNSLGTDLSMWAEQMPALTERFRVIRYDTRGHGGSAGGDGPISMARLGADALAILDALEIDRVHWLGLSMGGAIGLWLLLNAPDRIDRAVLANIAPKLGDPETWNARIGSVLAHGMEENAAATIERWFSPDFIARAPERVGAIHAMLRSTPARGYAACCGALRDMDLRERLRAIGHDVLIVTGRDDPVVPAADAALFVDGIEGAKHVVLGARHMSNIEAAEAFNAAVIAFLTARPKVRPRPARAKAAPKRGGISRRSNAARNPLKTAPAKKTAAKALRRASGTTAKASTQRRASAKTSATRRATPKAAAKKTAAKKPAIKASRKAGTLRRPTSTAAARGAVKKAKPRKATLKNTAKSTAKKAAVKSGAKKLPAVRRRPAKKPRRPSGRRPK